MNASPPTSSRAERTALIVLGCFTALAIAGYGYYALHPENLPATGFALRFYTISFGVFSQLHILVSFLALAILLVRRTGARWVPALAAVYLLSWASEHVGTGYGIPFGGYGYTGLLGMRLGPRVPVLIPLSWFIMALPSWVIARAVLPGKRLAPIVLGALGLVLWDLALDPAMSFLTAYWRWEDSGPYYGMPWLNLVGWFATGLALMSALSVAGRGGAFDELPVRWMAMFYGLVVALPLGMLAAAGSWLAVATTIFAIALTGAIVTVLRGGSVVSSGTTSAHTADAAVAS
ncbi:MAG: carotenoid biosynthesis protein [Gemmatimonadota bacterium]|nr:carotenoid biosynthesis protein [Gemmatimonadota bacterium]